MWQTSFVMSSVSSDLTTVFVRHREAPLKLSLGSPQATFVGIPASPRLALKSLKTFGYRHSSPSDEGELTPLENRAVFRRLSPGYICKVWLSRRENSRNSIVVRVLKIASGHWSSSSVLSGRHIKAFLETIKLETIKLLALLPTTTGK